MKKLFNTLIVLAVLAIIIRVGFNLIVGGHSISYEIKSDDQVFKIVEDFSIGYKSSYRYEKDHSNYLFQISFSGNNEPTFVFKILGNYNYYQRLISDIKYYEDNKLKCIYPVLKTGNYNNDVLCLEDNKLTYYTRIKGKYRGLDNFVNKLYTEYKYAHPGWFNTSDDIKKVDNVEIYRSNINKNHSLVLWNYTGVRTVTKTDNIVTTLMLKDDYENKLGVLVDRHYVIPSYTKTQKFSKFIVLDVVSNSKKNILLIKDISMDSYIQGIVNNKLYIFDKSSKIQYEIDPKEKTCIQVGDADEVKYFSGSWGTMSVHDALNEKKFSIEYDVPETLKQYKYYRIDSVLGDKDGYYYLYVKANNRTRVYRADKQRPEYITYLFDTDKISNIKYVDDYIYFIKDDTIYGYHETIGLRPMIKSFELFFNKSNVYDIYSK